MQCALTADRPILLNCVGAEQLFTFLFSPPLPLNGTYLVFPPPKAVAFSETKMIKCQLKLVPEAELWRICGLEEEVLGQPLIYTVWTQSHCFTGCHANSPVQCVRLT